MSSISSRGSERLDQFMALLEDLDADVGAFEKSVRDTEHCDERMAGRLVRMKRGLVNLRNESNERLDAEGFDHSKDGDNEAFQTARHDLRNRLNPVSLACQGLMRTLSKSAGPQDLLEILDRVQGVINECLKLIDSFGVVPKEVIGDIEPGGAKVLPFTQATAVLEASAEEEQLSKFAGKLLVVDDSVDDREELIETLREAGHEVTAAGEGAEALDILLSDEIEFDVVLLDLSMPGMDGKEVLRELRRRGRLKYLPVIVVTGRRGEDDAVDCITIGAEGFLTKPVRSKLLLAEVDRSMEKRRLREREFEQFFPPTVARHFARHPDSSEMEARQAEVSVLFCDIRGFSGISERLGGYRTVPWLRDVLETFSQCVLDQEGVLVDYTGDEVMAMWGAPRQIDDHAERACTAALAMLASLKDLNDEWQEQIGCETNVGIGVNSGLAHVGNIGTRRKLKYGPLGNTVNLASRVQGATSHAKTRFIVTKETRDGLSPEKVALTRQLCDVRVKNIIEPVRLYEMAQATRPNWSRIRTDYETALEQFYQQDFPTALAKLGNLLRECPDDGPALLLMGRVVEAMSTDDRAFDPVWELPGK